MSIIIVNWNGEHLIRKCLDSVYKQSIADFEVIFVDNGSFDSSIAIVRDEYPAVRIIELEHNCGFAGGNNEGIAYATGEFIVLLNTDATIADNWLDVTIDAMNSDSTLGSCFSKIVIEGTNLIDSAGDQFSNAFHAVKIGEYEDERIHCERKFVSGSCAAAVMYRRSMITQIGFFDQDFFLNAEDTDLNMRAWLAGWKCLFIPESIAYHQVSATLGQMSDIAVFHYSRNIEWVWLKNVPFKLMIKYLPQRILYELVSFSFYCIINRKIVPYVKGKIDAYRYIQKTLRKRKHIQSLVKLNNQELSAGLIAFHKYLLHGINAFLKQ